MRAIGLPRLQYPMVGDMPLPTLLLLGGLAAGLLLALLVRPLLRLGARRARQRAENRLRVAVAEVGREYVVAPVREVLTSYATARESFTEVRG